jgi:hypothetical protein
VEQEMANEPKKPKQHSRVDEEFELSEFMIKDNPRPEFARVVIYGGTAALCTTALIWLCTGNCVPLSAAAAVTVPAMMLVLRHYFR